MTADNAASVRGGIVAAGAVLIFLATFAGLFAGIAVGMGYCGGDGGEPYADSGSPRGQLCAKEDTLGLLIFPAPELLVAVGTVVACVRRRWTALAVGAVLGLVAFAAPLTMLSDAGGDCSEYAYASGVCEGSS